MLRTRKLVELPLSSAQQELWFDPYRDPEDPDWSLGGLLEIQGSLDAEVFDRAVRHVVERTSALRLRFGPDRLQPTQSIADLPAGRLEFLSFAHEPDPERSAREWVQRETRKPFELCTATCRFALLELGRERF